MTPPSEFASRLAHDFNNRLRIRWSILGHEWHIEEKVGRASVPPIKIDEGRDDLIRARDGYVFVLAVRPGDRMPCPTCRAELRVPVMKFGEAVCAACSQAQKRTVGYRASYWPLGESLLEHLRKIDPLTDGHRRMVREADEANRLAEKARQREMSNTIEATTKDILPQIGGWTQVGYTGREQYQE